MRRRKKERVLSFLEVPGAVDWHAWLLPSQSCRAGGQRVLGKVAGRSGWQERGWEAEGVSCLRCPV